MGPSSLSLCLRKVCWVASLIVRIKLNILSEIEEDYVRYWWESILLPFSKNQYSISYNSIFLSLSQIPVADFKKIITAFVRHLTIYDPYHLLQIFQFYFRILMKFLYLFNSSFFILTIQDSTQISSNHLEEYWINVMYIADFGTGSEKNVLWQFIQFSLIDYAPECLCTLFKFYSQGGLP